MQEWARKFYNSDRWRACRDTFMQGKLYLCERCSTKLVPVPAKIAHHKIYLNKNNIHDPYVALRFDNLESLCQDCHNKEHHKIGAAAERYKFDAEGNLLHSPHPK